MAPLSSTSSSSASLAPLFQNGMNLPISTTPSSLNLKQTSIHDDIKSSDVSEQLATAAAASSKRINRPIGTVLPAADDANDRARLAASAPSKKLFLSRKRRMNDDSASRDDLKLVKLEPPANETLQYSFQSVLNTLSSSTCNRQHQPITMDESLSAGAVASALCATKRQAPPPPPPPPPPLQPTKGIVTPDTRCPFQPTIRPLETDFCFGPGTSRNPGNKALKHIAYYATLPYIKETARYVTNENLVIAKKVIAVWTRTGGRFLEPDDKSALWLPVQDDDFILAKIQRSIGSWKGAWKRELKD